MTPMGTPPLGPAITFVCAAVFLGAVDFYIVSVAIPDLLRSFPGAGITGISWVINGYTVTFTAALLPAGGLADRYGRRRVFLCGLAVFALSALACALRRQRPLSSRPAAACRAPAAARSRRSR